MAPFRPIFVILLFALHFVHTPASEADTKLVFPPLPSSSPPKSETEYDDKGLQPLINIANSFIKTVKNDGLPYDLINEQLKKAFENEAESTPTPSRRRLLVFGIENEFINDLLDYEKEFIIVFGIGIALALLFLIIGSIFFCCRMCGHCGGDLVYEGEDKRANLKRWLMIVFLVIFLGLATVGCICAFVTNTRMSDSIVKVNSTFSNAIDDIYNFVDDAMADLSFIVDDQYTIVADKIFDEIGNVGKTLGVPIVATFRPLVKRAVDSVLVMADTVDVVRVSLYDVNKTVGGLVGIGTSLEAQLIVVNDNLTTLRQTCQAKGPPLSFVCDEYLPDQIEVEADFTKVPDVTREINRLDDVLRVDLRVQARKGNQTFEDIPTTVQNKTDIATDDVRRDADSFQSDIQAVVSDVNQTAREVLDDTLGLRSVQADVSGYIELAQKYDKYRFAVGVSLSVMILLVIIFGVLGLCMGELNRKSDVSPTNRAAGSNCGGQSLILSAVLVVIFSFFLLLLASICFLVGANVKVFCDPVENLEFWENTLDNGKGFDYYFLGRQIFNNDSFPLGISNLMRDCDKNLALYEALRLKEKPEANIRERFDIEKQIPALRENLDELKVDINDVDVLPEDARQNLVDFNNTGIDDINFDDYSAQIDKQLVNTDLPSVVSNLTALAGEFQRGQEYELGNQTQAIADGLDMIQTSVIIPGTGLKDTLGVQVKYLESNASRIQESVGDLLDLVDELEILLHGNGSILINTSVVEFTDRLIGYVTDFADAAVGWIETDVGRCKNIRTVYDATTVTLCRFTLDGLNGFWFSVGWSVFFMFFAMVIAINLSYHYRKLHRMGGFDSDSYDGGYTKSGKSMRMDQKKSWVGSEVRHGPQSYESSKEADANSNDCLSPM